MSAKYRLMAKSLHNGESTYQIEEVKVLRQRVLITAERVNGVAVKIKALPSEEGSRTETLQGRIKNAATNFVKETLVGLPSVPTEEEFEAIKK